MNDKAPTTEKDARYPAPSGRLRWRVHGTARILRNRAQSCRERAQNLNPASQEAASLRGKARGFDEAADLVERIEHGQRLPPYDWREGRVTSPGSSAP